MQSVKVELSIRASIIANIVPSMFFGSYHEFMRALVADLLECHVSDLTIHVVLKDYSIVSPDESYTDTFTIYQIIRTHPQTKHAHFFDGTNSYIYFAIKND